MTILVVMGVSGSGKTTIASGLARHEGWTLLEGDKFHPASNVAKMASGTPLTDEDRWPWLHAIASAIDGSIARGESAVVACSALKRAYRDILIGERKGVFLVYLRGSKEVIGQRMAQRKDHFMPLALLDSQFAALEEPSPEEHAIVTDIGPTPDEIVADVERQLRERSA